MIKFRPIDEEEYGVFRSLDVEFGIDIEAMLGEKKIVVGHGRRREVFITNEETFDLLEGMEKGPYFVGLYLGDIKGKNFILGLEGASLMSGHTEKKVVVGPKVEQLVLYGRDVSPNSVLEVGEDIKVGDRVLIVNERDECVGIGKVRKGEVFIENLMDRGWYLRKGE
ncbi:MAG: PUA domain-containing protein [Candidatus Hydrothermarchaeales archaeon]